MPKSSTTRIGVTLGDPSGIGPEVVVKALTRMSAEVSARVIIFGDSEVLATTCSSLNLSPTLEVSSDCGCPLSTVTPGVPTQATGKAQIEYLEAAVRAAKAGAIAAIATAPISKASAQDAGFRFPGHTEFFADRFNADPVAMMFAGPKLKVVLATVHEAFAEVPRLLTRENVTAAITLAAKSLQGSFGVRAPSIGVLGLNPHAGEGGRFGSEEQTIIGPAIADCQKSLGPEVQISGPLVPDAAFRMKFDAFVAMYHDQGLIPVKLIDFDESVNTTLGLPIVRTSPCHGVAYDIAGQGLASADSMQAAIELALQLA